MKIKTNQLIDNLIWVLTVVWFSSFTLFETVALGRYMLLGIAMVIFLLHAYKNKGYIRVTLTPWHCFVAVFAIFICISSLWALNTRDALEKGTTIFLILACFSLVYVHYQQEDSVKKMISAVKWAGYIVAIYAILFYGFDNVVAMIENEDRIDNAFSNVNTIGMLCAMGVVIQVYELVHNRKFAISILFGVPAFMIIAVSQSRKALILALAGIVLTFVTESFKSKKVLTAFFRAIVALVGSSILIWGILQMPMFAGVLDRMEEIAAMITGKGFVGNSVTIRSRMVNLGWEYFLKNPIGGVGIGCSHILAASFLRLDTYLHNNYIELLSGGGLIGFFLFYGMYIYLIVNMFKYRSYADSEYWLCAIIIVLLLIMDYGAVSYYTKQAYFYFMLLFLEVSKLKRRSCNYATNEVDQQGKEISNG